MPKARRVYCTHCGQTYISSSADTCSLCGQSGGLADPDSPDALHDLRTKKELEGHAPPLEPTLGHAFDTSLRAWRTIKLSLASVGLIALGVMLLVSPSMRADPTSLAFTEILLALPPLLAGAFLLFLIYLTLTDKRGHS